MNASSNKPEVSVVLPCRNEEDSLGECITKIKNVLRDHKIHGEIIVSDSSDDRSPSIAKNLGVKLVKHEKEGYGRAYLEGFKVTKGKYIFCADPDGTYDFSEIPRFLSHLDKGYDLVVGNRFKGKIENRAMPWLRRYIGNPLISWALHFCFQSKAKDALCGMRAIKKPILKKLELQSEGMEFASEMIIKATQNNLKIKELPINYYRRKGESKLKTFPDGIRHLKLMIILGLNKDLSR